MIIRISCRLIYLILFFFVACSAKTPVTSHFKNELESPYLLTIKDEIYDGETLFLQLELIEKSKLPGNLTFLHLIGVDQNKVKVEKYFNFVDLQKDRNQLVTLALPIVDLVDYQIQLYWGKQALEFYRIIYPKISTNLVIANGQVDKLRECQKELCKIKFRIKFDLINNNDFTIPHFNLILSLLKKDENDQIVEDAEFYAKKISVSDLNMTKGAVKNLEYLIAQPEELNDISTIAQIEVSDTLED